MVLALSVLPYPVLCATASDWTELRAACTTSGTITLSPQFKMGTYTEAISFINKSLVIWGNNATLDAKQGGAFFDGGSHPLYPSPPADTVVALELHDLVMQNGRVGDTKMLTVQVEMHQT